jgi:hypothetical protein
VDASVRTHLVGSGNPAAMSVPFVYDHVKMTVLKGEDALAARRHIASKLTPSLITALQRPRRVDDKPNWAPMQQLHDAGIRRNPVTGTAVFNPENCKPSLLTALWKADGGVADTINTKQMGQTDEALDELQMRLHEHAAQLREVAPRSSRLSRSDGTLAKRSRGASPTASLSDEATDTGEAATVRKRRVITESDDEEPMPMGSCAGLDDDELSALEPDGGDEFSALERDLEHDTHPPPPRSPPLSSPPSPPPAEQPLPAVGASAADEGVRDEALEEALKVLARVDPQRGPKPTSANRAAVLRRAARARAKLAAEAKAPAEASSSVKAPKNAALPRMPRKPERVKDAADDAARMADYVAEREAAKVAKQAHKAMMELRHQLDAAEKLRKERGLTPLKQAILAEEKATAQRLLLLTMKRVDPLEQMRLAYFLDPEDKEWVLNERDAVVAQAEDERRAAGPDGTYILGGWMTDYTARRWDRQRRQQRRESTSGDDEQDVDDFHTTHFYRICEQIESELGLPGSTGPAATDFDERLANLEKSFPHLHVRELHVMLTMPFDEQLRAKVVDMAALNRLRNPSGSGLAQLMRAPHERRPPLRWHRWRDLEVPATLGGGSFGDKVLAMRAFLEKVGAWRAPE